jgi:hypothetical protein
MVGAILLESIRYSLRVTGWKNLTAIHYPVLGAAFMLLFTMFVETHEALLQAPHALLTLAGLTRTVAQLLIVGVSYIRTMTIQNFKKGSKIVTYAVTVIFVLFIVFQRVVGTIAEWQPVNIQLLQATRIGINICSVIGVLYFELYTTLVIYGSSNAGIGSMTDEKSLIKTIPFRVKALAYSYTFGIVFVFVYQLILASLRFAGRPVGATNLMTVGWALILKRIMEFKEEYEFVRDGSHINQSSQIRSAAAKALRSMESGTEHT